MKNVIVPLLLALTTTASAVVADGDKRDHSTIASIAVNAGDALTMVTQAEVDEVTKDFGLALKPGFTIVGVLKLNEEGACTGGIAADSVSKDEPLIYIGNSHYVLMISQADQKAPLAIVDDIIAQPTVPTEVP